MCLASRMTHHLCPTLVLTVLDLLAIQHGTPEAQRRKGGGPRELLQGPHAPAHPAAQCLREGEEGREQAQRGC